MKAAVHTRYGEPDVVHVTDVARPVPADDEVLIRVHASTVNRTDCGMRSATPWITRFFSGWRGPKSQILGSEFAGVVEGVGHAVTEFSVGDRVFGVSAARYGAHAEYLCMKAGAAMATMPDNIPFEVAAAATDGAILAMTYLRRVDLRKGHRILIYGASGAIGSAGVQLAKLAGAHGSEAGRFVKAARDRSRCDQTSTRRRLVSTFTPGPCVLDTVILRR